MGSERSLVARRIEEIRTAKKLSRQKLADLLNELDTDKTFTRLKVWRIETGAVEVSTETAVVVAKALDVSVAYLFREAKAS